MFARCLDHVSALTSTPMVSSSTEDGGLAQCFLDNRVHADFVVRFRLWEWTIFRPSLTCSRGCDLRERVGSVREVG